MNPADIPDRVDGTLSTQSVSATCRHCRHLLASKPHACDAFPEGIPDELWFAYRGHRGPFPGDHGIQFSERPLPNPLLAERYDVPEFLKAPEKP